MKKRIVHKLTALAVASGVLMAPAYAQDMTAGTIAAQASSLAKGYASGAFQVPSASGSGWGSVGVGLYGQTVDDPRKDYDGSAGLNFGFGNPAEYVGLDVSVSLSSLLGSKGSPDSFGESGSFGAKLHTNLPGMTSFAVGVQSIGRFGAAKANSSSVYTSLSKSFVTGKYGFSATIGAGDTAFTTGSGVGVFGSLGWFLTPQLALIAEHTGRFANVGVSAAPIKSLPLSLTAGAVNLEDRFGIGTQFAMSVGYGFSF